MAAALVRLGVATAVLVTAGAAAGCGPSRPETPEAYVVADVGGVATRTGGADVGAYEKVFGADSTVYAVGDPDPESGLPRAVVAVVPIGAGTAEADVLTRAFGPGDVVVEREVSAAGGDAGGDRVRVRSATSRQGDITLQVRVWRPAAGIAVVVIATGSPEAADAVVEAVAAHAG